MKTNGERLIDANRLLETARMKRECIEQKTIPVENVFAAPTVDAVKVVRCKDCKHRHSSEFCECRDEMAFCSDGERQ